LIKALLFLVCSVLQDVARLAVEGLTDGFEKENYFGLHRL